jgi:hypothetical protein
MMNDPIILRAKLRAALLLAPRREDGRRELSETMLHTSVERLVGGPVSVPEFRAALEWNHARNFTEYAWNEDAEANFWELTNKGRKKETGR